MSLRWKTIVGIALIEAALLGLLIVMGVRSVGELGRQEVVTRAESTMALAESMSQDAVVATDLSALQDFAKEVARNPGVRYVRILSHGRVLAQAGSADELARPFFADATVDIENDPVYDLARDIELGGQVFGRIELGIDTAQAGRLLSAMRHNASAIALLEMMLVAGFSWVLGSYLLRQLRELRLGASRLAAGNFDQPIPVRGRDEIATTARAFNTMMDRLRHSDASLREALQTQTTATEQLAVHDLELQRQRRVMQAVTTIQGAYIAGRGQEATCRIAMAELLSLTESGCAFLAEVDADSAESPAPMVRFTVEAHMPCPAASWSAALTRFSDEVLRACGDDDWLLVDPSGIADSRLADAARGLPFGSLLALPVRLGGRVAGLLCLARTEPAFDVDDAQQLQPLISTLGQLLGAYRSEQRRAEAAAHAERLLAELDALFSLSPDGVAFFNSEGRVSVCNPALGSMLDRPRELLQGLDAQQFDALLRSLGSITPDDDDSEILTLRHPRALILQCTRRVLRNADGDAIGQALYARDITHASEVDRMKSEFLSTAAHELRTPLASIHGFSELLLSREFDDPTRRELLQTIYGQSQALTGMVNELLDLARIESRGGQDFEIVSTELAPLVEQAVTALSLPDRRHRLLLDLPGGLPPIDVDAAKFSQVLTNVLANAVKYSPAGGDIRIYARIENREAGRQLGLHVEDPGIGMTADQLARAFERFYRADASGSIPGTGLGLSLVREIMMLHAGSVSIASQPGQGSKVSLWFPLPADKVDARIS